MENKSRINLSLVFCVGLLAASLIVSGCTSVRQKFVRKKTEKKSDEVMPVLDPIEYPPVNHTSEQKYSAAYSMWKIWNKDLISAITENDSDKRTKYLFAESLGQLEKMNSLLADPQRQELSALIDELRMYSAKFDLPTQMRNESSIKRSLESTAKAIRLRYAPAVVAENLVQ